MSKFGMAMAPNQHQSTLHPPLLLCPTSKVELLNPVASFGVSNIILKPLSCEKHLLDPTPPLFQVEPMFDQWVGVLEAPRVWLLHHAKVVPP
jgi:hypothetical protein